MYREYHVYVRVTQANYLNLSATPLKYYFPTGFNVGLSKNFFLLGMYIISRYSASHVLNRSQAFNTLSFVTFLSSLPSLSSITASFTAESSNHVSCIAGTSCKFLKILVLRLNSFLYRSHCRDSRHSV